MRIHASNEQCFDLFFATFRALRQPHLGQLSLLLFEFWQFQSYLNIDSQGRDRVDGEHSLGRLAENAHFIDRQQVS